LNLTIAENMALKLMSKHGISNWSFIWSDAKTSFGHCNYNKCQIALSKVLTALVDEAHVIDTILHEIAHALTPGQHHNNIWLDKFRSLGGRGTRTSDIKIEDKDLPPKWVMVYKGEIIKRYFRKPNKNTFKDLPYIELIGKPESLGKLQLVEFKRYEITNDCTN